MAGPLEVNKTGCMTDNSHFLLQGEDQRVAAQVALECCQAESAYNPFYAQVLARLVQARGLPRLAMRHCVDERMRRCSLATESCVSSSA